MQIDTLLAIILIFLFDWALFICNRGPLLIIQGLFGFVARCSLARIINQASFVQTKSILVVLFGLGGLR